MKTLYAFAVLALMSGSAQAWDINTTCTYSRFYGSTCKTQVLADPPRDYAREAEDEAAKQERIRKWEEFCKPARTYDSEGVIRLVYARKGCEFGRSE
ncbi:hypothetical protein [uncultured Bradyrhizobium sp.]|uniref:hypothetical protein n=1 Tax=uncultured Bradyrhizobium sp. TaxID=199684 RepID=UPI0035CC1804